MISTDRPIFVRGLSRSGGTLVCTLLDAHPDVAFSYELYPNLLEVDEAHASGSALFDLATQIERSKNVQDAAPTPRFGTFAIRTARGGLEKADFAQLIRQLAEEGGDLGTLDGRLRLIELCAVAKMHREDKTRWGMKCNSRYDEYLSRWPQACFLNVLRDGRDVLASQLNTGSFNKTPAEVGRGWMRTHRGFEKLRRREDVCAHVVRYEALTTDPENELKALCNAVGLAFDTSMLSHTDLDLTIFKAKHLSRDRVASEIDSTRVGRWRKDLSEEQLEEFLAVAGEALESFGYD